MVGRVRQDRGQGWGTGPMSQGQHLCLEGGEAGQRGHEETRDKGEGG